MDKTYFESYKQMKEYALSYSQDWYIIIFHYSLCNCKLICKTFTILDRKAGFEIEILCLCSKCKATIL